MKPTSTLDVEVSFAARRPWVPRRAQFVTWARCAVAPAVPSRGMTRPGATSSAARVRVLSILIVGAVRSRSLNARYRGKDKPTNVLSFAGAGPAPDGCDYLGELVLCAPVVEREAVSGGRSRQAHWAHLTVHGVLHLLGFDHERAAEAAAMAVREVQILDRLGFSDPYA